MALPISQPEAVTISEGIAGAGSGFLLGNNIYLLFHDGVPTGGDDWAGPGTLVIDYTNSDVYMNTGTKASPSWTKKVD